MHSKNFDKVKYYYDSGFWNVSRVYAVVGKWITAEECKEITDTTEECEEIADLDYNE